MSLISSVSYYVPKIFGYTKRLAKAAPYIIFEDAALKGAKAASAVTKGAGESWVSVLKNMIKEGGKGIEASVAATKKAVGGNFFKAALRSIKEIPSVIKVSTKWSAARALVAAKAAGKTGMAAKLAGVLGGAKGFFKGIGKKMPIIGNILLVAFELPNIIKATKEQGIGQGVAEVVKAGTRLTAASIASAIGTTLAGPIGGIAGFVIGDWLASKVVGKSYTEKLVQKAEKDAEALERVQRMQQEGRMPQSITTQTVPFTGNSNPFANPNLGNAVAYNYGADSLSNPYANDIMMQNMKFNAVI